MTSTASHTDQSAEGGSSEWAPLERAAFAAQALLLVSAAFRNLGSLNTDAVAYIRIAGYFAEWNTELMISGYWGPLLSWLMVPFRWLGMDGVPAARVAMILSGVVFLFGSRAVFVSLGLDRRSRITGLWIAAAFSVFWSVRHITPDLLLAGLMGVAIAGVMDRSWVTSREAAALAGVAWGLAYYSKAIAFPLAILSTATGAALVWFSGGTKAKEALRQATWTLATFAALAGPWMLVLSLKYGGPTFSTSGRINHAIAGPPDVERYHPFAKVLHRPDRGRVTQWEDPSGMGYNFWSPFDNASAARHQAGIVVENVPKVVNYFGGFNVAHLLRSNFVVSARDLFVLIPGFDLLYLPLIGLVGCLVMRGGIRERLRSERWRWAVGPVILMGGLYLPVYLRSDDLRYFYPAFPFVWVAVVGVGVGLAERFGKGADDAEAWALRISTASFALPAMIWLLAVLVGIPNAGNDFAKELANRMEKAGLSGPIAGSATLQGGRAGLYTAFHLGAPWLGDDENAGAGEFAESGAEYVIATVFDSRIESIARDERFEDATSALFAPEEQEILPLRVFRRSGAVVD